MSDLSSFAQLMQAAAEEKRLRELAEKTRKVTEVAPLLSELFSTVVKAKSQENIVAITAQVIENIKIEKSPVIKIEENSSEHTTIQEKNFSGILNKLQSEIASLQRQLNNRGSSYGYPTSGSGEVKILRMDDVDSSNLQQNSVMVYDTNIKKFRLSQLHNNIFSNVIHEPTIIDEDMSYTVISYLKIKNTLHIKGNLGIR